MPEVVVLVVHVRSFLARHRVVHWGIVGSIACTVAVLLAEQSRQLERERRRWAETGSVWVASAPLAAGDPALVERRVLPIAAIPDDALDATDGRPVVGVVLQRVSRNEVLTTADLGADTIDLMPDGWRGVAITTDDTTVAAPVGTRVDVVADGSVLASDGVVTAVTEASITVGVPAVSAPAVASASLERRAVVVLRSDP